MKNRRYYANDLLCSGRVNTYFMLIKSRASAKNINECIYLAIKYYINIIIVIILSREKNVRKPERLLKNKFLLRASAVPPKDVFTARCLSFEFPVSR